jgi:PKD domain
MTIQVTHDFVRMCLKKSLGGYMGAAIFRCAVTWKQLLSIFAIVLAGCGGGGGGGSGGGTVVAHQGSWSGSASDGRIVNLVVNDSGIANAFVGFCNGSISFNTTPPIGINGNGGFSYSDSSISISGTLRSDGSASGTVSDRCGSGDRSWSASKTSDRIDAATPVAQISTPNPVETPLAQAVTLTGVVTGTAVGDEIYNWVVISKPAGSTATLANVANSTFVADSEGTFEIGLFLSNGVFKGPTVKTTVRVGAPTAVLAGVPTGFSNFGAVVGSPVVLDANQSTDPEGGPLTYSWSVTLKPAGSVATITNPNSTKVSFTPDVGSFADVYGVSVTVSDGHSSTTKTVFLKIRERSGIEPYAHAGANQEATVGVPVDLDGTASRTIDGAPLTYAWFVSTRPAGSVATIANRTTVRPTFAPDVAGIYTLKLEVTDRAGSPFASDATVKITAVTGNAAPVARAGDDQSVALGATVALSGATSGDANSDGLSYRWAILSKPAGSLAALSSSTVAAPTFVTENSGIYVVQLIVSDGVKSSVPDTVVITIP